MMKSAATLAILLIFLTGCTQSNDFTPTPEMSGEDIFKAACAECHSPKGDFVMLLSEGMGDSDLIANQVLSGSMTMPAFPNLQGEPAKKLADYVLANSKVTE